MSPTGSPTVDGVAKELRGVTVLKAARRLGPSRKGSYLSNDSGGTTEAVYTSVGGMVAYKK